MAENGVIKSRLLNGKHDMNEMNGKDSDFSNHVKNGKFRHESNSPSMGKQLGIKGGFWTATICYLVLFPLLFLRLLKRLLFGERSIRDTSLQAYPITLYSLSPHLNHIDRADSSMLVHHLRWTVMWSAYTANPLAINPTFIDQSRHIFIQVALRLSRGLSLTPFQTHSFTEKFWKHLGKNSGPLTSRPQSWSAISHHTLITVMKAGIKL
ncbi:unnamed protein product [Timema podura]|uniref:Uncharacterized protein n=1 Tax=Timema podura TaxID=61482 RepID=A0ABN7P3B3_TIMPD|nr:unnamed protein product [Timema podura]